MASENKSISIDMHRYVLSMKCIFSGSSRQSWKENNILQDVMLGEHSLETKEPDRLIKTLSFLFSCAILRIGIIIEVKLSVRSSSVKVNCWKWCKMEVLQNICLKKLFFCVSLKSISFHPWPGHQTLVYHQWCIQWIRNRLFTFWHIRNGETKIFIMCRNNNRYYWHHNLSMLCCYE